MCWNKENVLTAVYRLSERDTQTTEREKQQTWVIGASSAAAGKV